MTAAPLPPPADLDRSRLRRSRASLAVFACIVVAGGLVRAVGFSAGTLYKDDAWVALTSRVPLSTAWHMVVTTPGFVLFERWWIGLNQATWWAQVPSFLASLVAIAGVYALLAQLKFSTSLRLVGATLMAFAVPAVVYATHVKPYSFDAVFTCSLLIVGLRVREHPSSQNLSSLVALSLVATWWSLSLAVVVVGVFACLGAHLWRARRVLGIVPIVGVAAIVASLVGERTVLSSQITGSLHRAWASSYLHGQSVGAFTRAIAVTSFRLVTDFTIGIGGSPAFIIGLTCACFWLAMCLLGRRTNSLALWVFVTAIGASIATLVPLGTQRTDIYLLPVLIVLVVSALQRLLVMLKRRGVARVVTTSSLVTGVVLLVAIELVVAPHRIAVEPGSSRETMLPNLKPAAALVNEALRTPSTAVLVANPPWEWVYAADTAFQVAPSEASQTGFTVLSREANVGLASVNNAGFTTVHLRALSLRMRKSARVILLARPKSSADVAIHRELSAAGWTLVATTAQQTEILERWIPHSAVGEATGPTR